MQHEPHLQCEQEVRQPTIPPLSSNSPLQEAARHLKCVSRDYATHRSLCIVQLSTSQSGTHSKVTNQL
jgi:hypothetical protein